MKLLLFLAHLSICFARDLFYKDKIANTKYGTFGASLATSTNKLIIGTMSYGPIFIVDEGRMESIPKPPGSFLFGLNVAANEHYILTNCAKGNRPPMSWFIFVYSAAHPHKLVAEIPVDKRGFIGAAIGEDNTIVIMTQLGTVIFYSYDGQGAWSQEHELNIGKHSLHPVHTVTISGNHAAVGMTQPNGEGEGYADIFERVKGVWTHTQTIKSSEYQFFGANLALYNNHLVVAANKHNKEQHAFVYRRNDASGEWLQEGHLTITIPTPVPTGYDPNFQVDCLIADEHLIAVSTKINGTIATKIFKESNGKWIEHVNLTAEPMDTFRQSNIAVRFGANKIVYTGRINPFVGGHKGGEVYVHDLSKIHGNERQS